MARLQLDAGPKRVNLRRRAGFDAIGGLIVERLCGADLGFGGFDQCLIGDALQVGVTDSENYQIAGILLRRLTGR